MFSSLNGLLFREELPDSCGFGEELEDEIFIGGMAFFFVLLTPQPSLKIDMRLSLDVLGNGFGRPPFC